MPLSSTATVDEIERPLGSQIQSMYLQPGHCSSTTLIFTHRERVDFGRTSGARGQRMFPISREYLLDV